jgi:three-Cys-motif partner protein
MNRDFYTKGFDDATNIKLEIFRHYIREWLPVFMTRKRDGSNRTKYVSIYDFFAGPGQDSAGNPGSPLIIVDEIKTYCMNNADFKADIAVRMIFNDVEEAYVEQLRRSVEAIACDQACCRIEYSALPFQQVLPDHISSMNEPWNANLVIMDQFGVKEVTPDVIRSLAQCSATDILFFISTSFIRRFADTPEIGGKYDLARDDLKNMEYNIIHRYICEYYRGKLGGMSYHLAPFSIRKGSNIYGVIFGSSHLLGLEKFLRVCWALDDITGEANYNIDGDFSWGGKQSLFEEHNRISKIDLFEEELRTYVASHKPDNILLNIFCLTKGFPPSKAGEVLTTLQEKGWLSVRDNETGKRARRGTFYLGWNNCKSRIPKVRFSMEAAS